MYIFPTPAEHRCDCQGESREAASCCVSCPNCERAIRAEAMEQHLTFCRGVELWSSFASK
jgi:hypothetical protein